MAGRKIFVDVGGHEGETLREVSAPLWKFDTIYCLEPQKPLALKLQEEFSDRPETTVIAAGLSDRTGQTTLYGRGGGASIFEGKEKSRS